MSTPTDAVAKGKAAPPFKALIVGSVIALAVAALGVGTLLVSSKNNTTTASSAPTDFSLAHVGNPVPTFSLPSLTGTGTVGVSDSGATKDVPAVLVFFASWCGPCQREMPSLSAAIRHGAAHGVSVVGIDGQDQESSAKAFVAKNKIIFPVGVDSTYQVTSGKFGFPGLPETVFVNKRGIVTQIHYGPTTPQLLRQGVAALRE